jgi:hypothetical protein
MTPSALLTDRRNVGSERIHSQQQSIGTIPTPQNVEGLTMYNILGWMHVAQFGAWGKDIIGYVASGLVLATFSMKSMRRLRAIAISSNFAFIAYAVAVHLVPVLVLHTIMLPMNIFRFVQAKQAVAPVVRRN